MIGANIRGELLPSEAAVKAHLIRAECFSFFLDKFPSDPIFSETMARLGYDSGRVVVPHSTYRINTASPDNRVRSSSMHQLARAVKYCEQLGIRMLNFHPGSSKGAIDTRTALLNVADSINFVHRKTSSTTTLIEIMPGAGNEVCGEFGHLATIIDSVEDKRRVGVCLDTCHMHVSGYDIVNDLSGVLSEFESVVGKRYLKALHLNDSVHEAGSRRDTHAPIGSGKLGLQFFRDLLNHPLVGGLPCILETPPVNHAKEITFLKGIVQQSIYSKRATVY